MKNLLIILTLFSTAAGFVRGDPNIYGPGGVNLGPNGDLPPSYQDLQQDKILEEEREQTRLLRQQVQKLEQIQQQQEQSQWNQQNQSRIQIQIPGGYNYGYQPYGNFGWIGVSPFRGSGFSRVSGRGRHHVGGRHNMGGRHNRR